MTRHVAHDVVCVVQFKRGEFTVLDGMDARVRFRGKDPMRLMLAICDACAEAGLSPVEYAEYRQRCDNDSRCKTSFH